MESIRRTPWSAQAPVRTFLRTESGSAGVLLLAIVAALVWANIDAGSYERVWTTSFSIRLGDVGITRDLRTWVNSGLMALFFLVVGLEARREIDLGDLRDRSRILLPAAAGLLGMAVPVAIYLIATAGGDGAHGWGVAMSTDTALALGLLVLVGRDVPDRVRAFLLTVFVVDDIVALIVIATVYTTHVHVMPLVVALVGFAVILAVKRAGYHPAPAAYAVLGLVIWAAMLASGIDPVVAGLAIGLTAAAYSPAREELEEASGLFRLFREQPTAELARSASLQLTSTVSPNDRLQRFYHPWTSYVIVPLFGLANAGVDVSPSFLGHALGSGITLGILFGYVVGKPFAVVSASWGIARMTHGRVRPAVGWAAVAGSGTIAGIGFTVSFLIAALAFHGRELAEAKLGVLLAGVLAALLTWIVFRITALLSPAKRTAALLGRAELIVDLVGDVDPERDHIRGPDDAAVTVVEYGDFQCPYCGQAEPAVRALLDTQDVRWVWRHLPLTDVHPQAQLAALASEAAAAQDAFWPMHDLLLDRQDHLTRADLLRYAGELGLDITRFGKDLDCATFAARVAADVESADLANVSGTPTLFVNGLRHYGEFDLDALTAAVHQARARAALVA
jgi:Na+/H+ antiporter NhaA